MKFIVVGCGRLGAGLAYELYLEGHQVVVIDQQEKAFLNLPPDFKGRTVEGDGLNQGVLERAGVDDAYGMATVTNSDTTNAAISHIAREQLNIAHIVTRNYDPTFIQVHEIYEHQVVSSTIWGAQQIKDTLLHENYHKVASVGNGQVEIFEMSIPTSWYGKKLANCLGKENIVPIAITRAGKTILADKEILMESQDRLIFSTASIKAVMLKNLLAEKEE